MLDLRLTAPDYPVGAPCWLDVLVADVARAQTFYGELFDWDWRPGDDATGGYTLALREGHPVAGISRRPEHATVPSQWTTYLRTKDAAAASAALVASGGRAIGSVAQLGHLGRSLIATDPGGALVGLWEPGELPGSGLLDVPGALAWNELLTRDYDAAQRFHTEIFGHSFREEGDDGEPRWSVASSSDGNPAFGLSEIGPDHPATIRPHWVASFATATPSPPSRGRSTSAPACSWGPTTARSGSARCSPAPRARSSPSSSPRTDLQSVGWAPRCSRTSST